VNRLLRLMLLAPDIQEGFLDGWLPKRPQPEELTPEPLMWEEQRSYFVDLFSLRRPAARGGATHGLAAYLFCRWSPVPKFTRQVQPVVAMGAKYDQLDLDKRIEMATLHAVGERSHHQRRGPWPARVSRRDEIEGDAVQAVAEPGRRGTVLEHVAEMPAASATMHLGPDQEQATLLRGANAARERRPEARPTRAAVELGLRREESQITTGAEVGARY
jgi:hypothetical protein